MHIAFASRFTTVNRNTSVRNHARLPTLVTGDHLNSSFDSSGSLPMNAAYSTNSSSLTFSATFDTCKERPVLLHPLVVLIRGPTNKEERHIHSIFKIMIDNTNRLIDVKLVSKDANPTSTLYLPNYRTRGRRCRYSHFRQSPLQLKVISTNEGL